MNVTEKTLLALDPQYCLRNDVDRAVLITRPKPLSTKNYICRLLRPAEAILLALMNGERPVGDVGRLWAELAGKSREDGERDVQGFVQHYTSGSLGAEGVLIEVDARNQGTIRQYDPMDFVIPARTVNIVDQRLRKPYMVYFLPTLFCPQKCIYCYARTRPKPETDLIALPRLREIFAELSALGVEVIQMSGGDPFARPDIFSIIESVVANGMTIDIPTKLGLGYEEELRLKSLGIDLVQISLDAVDPEILEEMVGVKNYQRKIFRVCENLRKAGIKIRTNTVLTPRNIHAVGPLIDFLGNLGNVVQVSLTPYGRSLFCHSDELFITPAELAQVGEQIRSLAPLYPQMRINLSGGGAPPPADPEERKERWAGRSFCTANRHGFVILPDGKVTVCEELYDHPSFIIGDLNRQSVMDVWSSPEALALLHPDQSAVPAGACSTCGEFAVCNAERGRCWRDTLKSYGWDKPHYPDPRCPYAPEGNRLS